MPTLNVQRCIFALSAIGNRDVRVVRHVVEQFLDLTLDIFEMHGGRCAGAIIIAARLLFGAEPDRLAVGYVVNGIVVVVAVAFVAVRRQRCGGLRGRSGYRARDPSHAADGRRAENLRNVHLARYFGLFHDGLCGRGTQRRVHNVAVVVTGKVGSYGFTLKERGERMGLIEI